MMLTLLQDQETRLGCAPQSRYCYLADGQAGREIQVTFKGAKLYAAAELEVTVDGQVVTVKVPAAPKGTSSASVLLPSGVSASKEAKGLITLKSGSKSLRQPIVPLFHQAFGAIQGEDRFSDDQ